MYITGINSLELMISCRNPQKFGLQILMLNTETLTLGAQIQTKAIDRITKKRHNHFEGS